MSPRDPSGALLACFYFSWIAAVGSFGPFLAAYLEDRGFSARGATLVLAALPVVRVVVTPAWTWLADATRAPSFVLRVVCLGAALAFGLLARATSPAALALALVGYTAFRAPVGALADSVALAWSARTGGAFGPVRAAGSAGYLVATFGVAATVERRGHGLGVGLTATLLLVAAAFAFALPAAAPRAPVALWPSFVRLARSPVVLRVLAAGVLQQAGLAPYEALFATWMTRRAGGVWAGASIALGVACEIAVMVWGRAWLTRAGPRRALVLSLAVSVARWLVTGLAPWWQLAALAQSLHAFAFASWFLAAVEAVGRAAPEEVRASAQGVHYTVVFGAGAAASLAVAGALGGVAAMREIWLLGAACSALAAWVAWGLPRELDGPAPR